MDLSAGDADHVFRKTVRQFLDTHLTPTLRRAGQRMTSIFADFDAAMAWHRILYEHNWITPDWPEEYGGIGWTLNQRDIFLEECRMAGAPALLPMGLAMLGPMLIRYGGEQQKAELLPRIRSGEDVWCQGYSEPNAGSDLASLQTRAVADGDDYVVNGAKIWTSYAHRANKIFCLVRTDPGARPQAGISFLLIDLDAPGITVSPIVGIDGEVEQCEVFFDDVRVPRANLVGTENQGWEVAKYLLEFERGGLSYFVPINQQLARLRKLAAEYTSPGGSCYLDEPLFAARLGRLEIDALALQAMEQRIKSQAAAGQNPGALSSLTKLIGTELGQQLDELGIELRGRYCAPLQNAALAPDFVGEPIGPESGIALTNAYLNNRASTIYGGTAQVQRNIIAKLVLGL